jgi:glucose/arabinose dehydrogenase
MLVRSALRGLVAVMVMAGVGVPALAQSLRATPVASGFSRPVGFIQHPTASNVQFVLEQGGRVRVLVNGVVQPNDFLNLTGQIASLGEQGLLGFAFAPDYATTGRVFVNFTNLAGHSVIARFERSATQPLRADPASRFDLVWHGQSFITQPFANHNGGHIAFGPDGYLYVGMGDGGSGNDPNHFAQNPMSLLGKMLRIDVAVSDTHPDGYVVPLDNPFTANPAVLPEIWSFGLRNPWRWSFDLPSLGGTGAIVIADVGQGAYEEINYEPAGAGGRNYGWRNREGAHDNVTTLPPYSTPLINPVWEYPRNLGRSITGGYVYRGAALPAAFRGRYFYADFATSRVWSIGLSINGATGAAAVTGVSEHTADLGSAAVNVSSFGIDAAGELHIVSHTGTVYRIGAVAPPAPGGCASVRPGPTWTCHNGGWLPPGATPPGGAPPPSPPPPPPPPSSGVCTSVRPGPTWTCHNGGWLPPGAAPPGGTPPPTSPPPPPPPASGACTTPRPGPDWTCRNGGWLPPGHPGGR